MDVPVGEAEIQAAMDADVALLTPLCLKHYDTIHTILSAHPLLLHGTGNLMATDAALLLTAMAAALEYKEMESHNG